MIKLFYKQKLGAQVLATFNNGKNKTNNNIIYKYLNILFRICAGIFGRENFAT